MEKSQQSGHTTRQPPPWLDFLTREQQRSSFALFGIGAAFAALGTWVGVKFGQEYISVGVWGWLLALIFVGAGLWQRFRQPATAISDVDATRLLVLAMGGLSGLVTTILSLALGWVWWQFISGGRKVWIGPDGWRIWVCLAAFLGGLVVMFVSLQLARSDERSTALLRRLLYGYNAVLGGIVLALFLLVLNVLTYIPDKWNPLSHLNKQLDWSRSSMYSLGSKSENILASLERPTKVYVIVPVDDVEVSRRVRALMDNCLAVTEKLQVEYLSPDLNQERVIELQKEHKFADRAGLLVVYGTGDPPQSQFVRLESLFERPDFSSNRPRVFRGEDALLTAIEFLKEGKQKPLIYFLQGHGELDIMDSQLDRRDQGAGLLKQRLENANYTVKGLELTPVAGIRSKNPQIVSSDKVPDDATLLVVAGPRMPLPSHAITAIRNYLEPPADVKPKTADPKAEQKNKPAEEKKKGKMIVLLDVVAPQGTMVQTGLENLLQDFSVEVGNNRIFQVPQNQSQLPMQALAIANPERMGMNLLAAQFARQVIPFYGVRTVEARQGSGRPGSERYSAESIFIVPPQFGVWAETDLRTDQIQLYNQLVMKRELEKKVSDTPLSVAVAISENVPGEGTGPHAFMQTEQRPKLLVFGDATWASNRYVSERGAGARYYDLFASCVAWLRERPSSIGIEPKKSDLFIMEPSTNFSRMALLPGLLAAVTIIGLGTGVWIVRRR